MSFGQPAGPPASAKQLAALEAALVDAGYAGFREARHPLGLTQRQANGKFTAGEAVELLERLEAAAEAADAPADEPPPAPRPAPRSPQRARPAPLARPVSRAGSPTADDVVTAFPDELLAEELVRRGWTCTPPS